MILPLVPTPTRDDSMDASADSEMNSLAVRSRAASSVASFFMVSSIGCVAEGGSVWSCEWSHSWIGFVSALGVATGRYTCRERLISFKLNWNAGGWVSYLGALELNLLDKGNAVPSRGQMVQHLEGCSAVQFTPIPCVRIRAQEKSKDVAVKISVEGAALETRK